MLNDDTDDINIAFIIYEKQTLFPVYEQNNNNAAKSIEIGSAIFGINVSDIVTGTKLNSNVSINFTLRRPNINEVSIESQVLI